MPPWVSERRMKSTRFIRPGPVVLVAFRRSQGIAPGSGDAFFWRGSPLTLLPSRDLQEGPTP